MNIFLNDLPVKLPSDSMTVAALVKWKGLPASGTAVAVNDKIVRKDKWDLAALNEFDRVTIISAAFGG